LEERRELKERAETHNRLALASTALRPQQPLGDDFGLDLAGALEDAEQPPIAPEALGRELLRVAVATEDLQPFGLLSLSW
jgi:hypothetical protein